MIQNTSLKENITNKASRDTHTSNKHNIIKKKTKKENMNIKSTPNIYNIYTVNISSR